MDPNQQPNQPVQPGQPAASPNPPPQVPPAMPPPQVPSSYAPTSQPAYDPNYLDSIAPAAPPPKFFSGSFGKIFFGLLGVFVFAVSLIIAFSGKDNTADLQQIAVRLGHMDLTAKTVHKNLTSSKLSSTNSNFQIWISNNQRDAEKLLQQAEVKKTQYNKEMVSEEKTRSTELDDKFEDARLNALLNRVYAYTMASETQQLINLYNAMSRNSKAKAIRDYAKNASANLKPIQEAFDSYSDDGN